MFDLVTEANEEPEVVCGIAINRRRLFVEASLKLPGCSFFMLLTSSDQTSGAPLLALK